MLEAHKIELDEQLETLKDSVKAFMNAQNLEHVSAGNHSVSWTSYSSRRFDTKLFKAEHQDLYEQYSKDIETKRFSVR